MQHLFPSTNRETQVYRFVSTRRSYGRLFYLVKQYDNGLTTLLGVYHDPVTAWSTL